MSGGGGGDPPLPNGGEFLLSLLQQRPNHQQPPPQFSYAPHHHHQQSPSAVDPAVAELGPTVLLPHQFFNRRSGGPDLAASPLWPHQFTQNPWTPTASQFSGGQLNNQRVSPEDLFGLGFPGSSSAPKLQFGSIPQSQVNALHELRVESSSRGVERKHQQAVGPPPGFSSRPRGGGVRKELDDHDVEVSSNGNNVSRRGSLRLAEQVDQPGPPAGSKLHSVSASDVGESFVKLRLVGGNVAGNNVGEEGDGVGESDDVGEELVDSLLMEGDSEDKKDKKVNRNVRDKEFRSDNRGQNILNQRLRMYKSQMRCRSDIDRFSAPFLAIYESLIPLEEEQAKQKQLMTLLERLVNKEWPEARLFLYGSCANSFGVSKSDIDVCLAIGEANVDKAKVLLKLASILQSDNLENVQALTRARVPIVKLMDPVTGISCDICVNNVLAVVNTKLLRDYAKIDSRLRQLAFVVKHWAKSRAVNETYQGTLSSYAYVLMCIHFLQQRRPAILPCLQAMEPTYSVNVDDVQCSFFDQVDRIRGFGSHNRESIANLVWGFFNYWAYRHDYANNVISVRAGTIISKREKDWTRRVGNDRHLICIEDPFETSHDLGRVVDKHSIRVLREEFERAAKIMQEDANPCVTLFERYVSTTSVSE